MEKNRLKDIKEIIIAFLLAIVFIFTQIFAYYQGVIFGADNHEIVEEVKDEVFNKKESNRRYIQPGTSVPTSGYVEKLYFNTSLSTSEVVTILSKLTYTQTPLFQAPLVPVLFAQDGNPIIFIGHTSYSHAESYFITIVTDMNNMQFVNAFDYNNGTDDGWKLNEYNINKNVISEYMGLSIGTQNELIINLVSTTPFPGNDVLTVPNIGYVENVYLNVYLNTSEVKNILKNLNYFKYDDNDLAYYVLCLEDLIDSITILTNNDKTEFIIAENIGGSLMYIFSTTSNVGFVGWNEEFDGIINVSSFVTNFTDDNISVGLENYKLTNLFSTTPFEKPLFLKQFIDDASDIVLGFITILVNATVSLTDIMYNESTNQLTIVGSAFALALAVGVVYLFFRLIRGLIRSNNRG